MTFVPVALPSSDREALASEIRRQRAAAASAALHARRERGFSQRRYHLPVALPARPARPYVALAAPGQQPLLQAWPALPHPGESRFGRFHNPPTTL